MQQLFFSLFESSRPREDIAEHTGRRSYQIVVPYVHVDVLGGADMTQTARAPNDSFTEKENGSLDTVRTFRNGTTTLVSFA